MKCRFTGCRTGILLSQTPCNLGGDVLKFSCGHQSRIYPEHNSRGRCAWCGAFLPHPLDAEQVEGLAGFLCGREGCRDLDSWLGTADDEAQRILDAAEALAREMAEKGLTEPPEPPAYLRPILEAEEE